MSEVLKRLIEIKKEIGHLKKESKGVHGNCRSIYDTYLATHDLFIKYGILMTCSGNDNGNMLWTFHCAEDDSMISTTVPMIDSMATFFDAGNAISYSQKYAIISILALPDESVNQSDPEINPQPEDEKPKEQPKPLSIPDKQPKKRVDESRGLKLNDRDWLYKIMLEYKVKKEHQKMVHDWLKTDAEYEGLTIRQLHNTIGEVKFKHTVDKFVSDAIKELTQ